MNDTVSPGNHHESDDARSSAPVDILAELADLRATLDTATSNLAMAEVAKEAANDALAAAEAADESARDDYLAASDAEAAAHRDYVNALKRHGYVLTADGPKPRDPR